MGNSIKPELTHLSNGELFKTLNITAKAGMEMPLHHTTKEAVIVVLKGEAILKMRDGQYTLLSGTTFIIPAKVEHSLKIIANFHAIAIMENTSTIEFKS